MWKDVEALLKKNSVGWHTVTWPELLFPAQITNMSKNGQYGLEEESFIATETSESMTRQSEAIKVAKMMEFELQDNYWNIRKQFKPERKA